MQYVSNFSNNSKAQELQFKMTEEDLFSKII